MSERGYSLVELLLAIVLAGMASISLLNCFTAAGEVTTRLENSYYARWLATGIKAEMDILPVVDPDQPPSFGCEPGEWSRYRASFDDIDDYAGWVAAPPEDMNGYPNQDLLGYSCVVEIQYVDPEDFTKSVQPGESDYLLCTVTIDREEKEIYTLQWLRTIH